MSKQEFLNYVLYRDGIPVYYGHTKQGIENEYRQQKGKTGNFKKFSSISFDGVRVTKATAQERTKTAIETHRIKRRAKPEYN